MKPSENLQKRLTSTRKFFKLFLFLFYSWKKNLIKPLYFVQQNCMINLNSLWLDFGCEIFQDNGKCD